MIKINLQEATDDANVFSVYSGYGLSYTEDNTVCVTDGFGNVIGEFVNDREAIEFIDDLKSGNSASVPDKTDATGLGSKFYDTFKTALGLQKLAPTWMRITSNRAFMPLIKDFESKNNCKVKLRKVDNVWEVIGFSKR